MSTVREQVRESVSANPGIHFNELTRRLDIATGQAQYHLRKLVRAGDINTEEIRGRTHYFDREHDPWERRTIALVRRETTRSIVGHLLEDGPLASVELVDRLDVARSTVSWHVESLIEAGVAEKSYGQRGRAVVALTRPTETRRLLQTVEPSLADRLVDRFSRLVDDSLGRDGYSNN
ncbi:MULTISPECIES: winged helix-turn-helix transcriptional regulator [Halomicrobium]|uniref:Transcriptional regulator, ArsR family n=2 Tax=Halomicrobium mukohataei TaxID=57705 RepID=C7NXP7_HALMD|nr:MULTISPECIES: winged helix-turn-helix transcriptional regulator [Halomicrobium]ACV46485.1 transcriptional regulator, ArsR family [Halomicrobium mukohataei DSM 12286]QCD65031.1 winged helix-turn-helix transcriptional regulator [Halomicrobium mukohataei]QFR19837.1 winged helix-turn-helix transcriptional regulator [Halomicrobium sp. ZPS1]